MTEPAKVEDNPAEEGEVVNNEVQTSPLETQAIGFGWKPKEKWVEDGNSEDDWVPAKHFLQFGEIKKQLVNKDKQLTKQEKIIKMMKNHHVNVKQAAYDDAVAALKVEKKAALENNDLIKVEEIKDRMDELREKSAKEKAIPAEIEKEEQEQIPVTQTPPTEYYQFLEKNPWYIQDPAKQDEMSREADVLGVAIVQRARNEGKNITYAEVYKAVEDRITKLFPDKFQKPVNPQQGSGRRSGVGGKMSSNLSEAELEVAKAFGLKPEDYAKEQATSGRKVYK